MNRRKFLHTTGAAAFGTAALGAAGLGRFPASRRSLSAQGARPNIVVIMADDMGFSDVGCYGGEIDTPNIDRLADGGMRFSQFYNAARCCPTRASLLTGVYPHQAGVGHMRADLGVPAYRGHLTDRCLTVAELLCEAGYRTAISGKWHLGEAHEHWPNARGFELFSGILQGVGHYFDPPPNRTVVRDNAPWAPKDVGFFEPKSNIVDDFYMTDFITEKSVDYIERFSRGDDPFFLYVPYTAPHWPLHAREEDIQKYRGRFDRGWDVLRRERYERLVDLGLIDSRWKLPERDSAVSAWDDVENKQEWARRMEVYAAMIDRMDHGIGRMLAALGNADLDENTLVLFLSDNGGSAESLRQDLDEPVGGPDSYAAVRRPWAHVSDTPFRNYKSWTHEGGIATPLIARWPGRIEGGTVDHTPGHVIDIMPTCLDLAGTSYPADDAIWPVEGASLNPLLHGTAPDDGDLAERALYWSHGNNHAVRSGRWKLVSSNGMENWELYDLADDRTETNDLSKQAPEKTRQLAAMHTEWADRIGVLPWAEYRAVRRQARSN